MKIPHTIQYLNPGLDLTLERALELCADSPTGSCSHSARSVVQSKHFCHQSADVLLTLGRSFNKQVVAWTVTVSVDLLACPRGKQPYETTKRFQIEGYIEPLSGLMIVRCKDVCEKHYDFWHLETNESTPCSLLEPKRFPITDDLQIIMVLDELRIGSKEWLAKKSTNSPLQLVPSEQPMEFTLQLV